MKKLNLQPGFMDVSSKISSKKFLQERINTIDVDSSILDAQYICDDSEKNVTLTTTLTGMVIGSDVAVYLDGNPIDLSDSKILGTNKDLNNKKIKIIQNVTAEKETSCVFSVILKGGYKDMVFHLSSKVGENGLFFIVYIECI